MPRTRFKWDAFDDITVAALARASGFVPQDGNDSARVWLGEKVKRPSAEFVRISKDVLVRDWLPNYEGSKDIVARLLDYGIGPVGNPQSSEDCARYVGKCRNSKWLRHFLREAMLRFGDQDRNGDEVPDDFVPRFSSLTVAEQKPDHRTPYDFQQNAWRALSAELALSESKGNFEGLLVMPTGAGKTYTAAHWLLKEVIARGSKVLWLVHRQELISQATAAFQQLAALAAPQKKLRIRAVSQAHCASTQIDPADDVIVASIGSLAKRKDIAARVIRGGERFVIIDEAHHAPANSYRSVVDQLKQTGRWKILGLTATPTRTLEGERAALSKIFGEKILYQISLKDLVLKGVLARPRPKRVATNANIAEQINERDIRHLETFHDLGEELQGKIAKLEGRNRTIVDEYILNRKEYGPTLIFAINVEHAVLLTDALKAKGVKADYVTCYRPDGSDGEPSIVINRFRDGELDVLVNVQILTEGVDVPGIKTVFLARPTMSEILMRQMVGRALRGKRAKGTEEAYLVSFEDHWERFRGWQSPFDMIPDVLALAQPQAGDGQEAHEQGELPAPIEVLDILPWEIIRTAAASLRELPASMKADVFEAVPHGYFAIAREDEGELVQITIGVYEHQRPCWDALLAHLGKSSPSTLEAMSSVEREGLFEEFFGDCDLPQASMDEVLSVVQHFAHEGGAPSYHDCADRKRCEPEEVARLIYDQDLGERARTVLLDERYTPLARAIYHELREYRAAVEDALFELHHPEESTRRVRAVPIFDPRPEQQMAPGPTHDLKPLLDKVLVQGAALLGVPRLEHVGPIIWTTRLVKGWSAYAHWRNDTPFGHGKIRFNRLLNSPNIDDEVIKFLLWHEYLHLHLKDGHTKEFRRLERLWPTCVESTTSLCTLDERFQVQYW